ncbi:uncharacterized protein LOC113355622 [Papaver somniferum]|uniref:uncharacterized protein LOC113355622 n=1 Tax=Papaver somniferum TaxID=3469 RepID=UPI000E702849|nr:uncharacterized protein LOC113355622 [Papaver somniferum]
MGPICDALNEREKGVPQSVESKSDSPVHTTPQKTPIVEKEYEHDSDSKNSTDDNASLPSFVPVAPFPQRLVQQKGSNQYNEMLEMFKRVNINIPFLEAIKQIPAYAKFLKDLCTQKRKYHVHKRAFLTEQVSSIIQNKTPPKFKGPGSPTITCTIGDHIIDRALLDLGTSVNLLPYSVYEKLGLGELKPTHVTLQLADRSVKIPCGRPFLVTSNAIINYRNGVLNLSFGNMTVESNIFRVSQQPMDFDDNELHEVNMIESLIQDSLPDILSMDPLQACLDNFDLDIFDSEYISEVHSLLESVPPMDIAKWQTVVEALPLSDSKSASSLVKQPKIDLKPLPDTR